MGFLATFDAVPDDKKLLLTIGALRQDPIPVLAELRVQRPVLQIPATPVNFVLITKRRDVQDALNHHSVFTVQPYQPKMDPSVGPFMLARDNTVFNQRDKGIMKALIQQSDMGQVRVKVAELACKAITEGVGADGRLDIVAQVSRKVPIQLTGAYFGFPGPDLDAMLRWSRATQEDMFYNQLNDPDIHQANVQAGAEMKAYLESYLLEQLDAIGNATAKDSVVTRLLAMIPPKEIGFDMTRVMSNTMGLLVGGVETTSAAISQAISVLLDHPDHLASAIQAAQDGDDQKFDGYVWEALRFYPQAPFVGRLMSADYIVGAGSDHATEVKAGTFALLSHASAMMDEGIEPDAAEFRPDRPDWWYMHLGYGPHRCLGDQVSQQQVPETVKQIFLAGYTKRAEGAAGQLDFKQGPFPESFTLLKSD